jgi:hypothetical protein
MTREQRQLAIAKATIANGLSFSIVEDKFFPTMFDEDEDIRQDSKWREKIYNSERVLSRRCSLSSSFVLSLTAGPADGTRV